MMSKIEPLNNENFLLYCARNYDARYGASTKEFYDDINRIKYIKKLITRYKTDNDLKVRLILNHIIVLNNVFGPEVTTRILYFKLRDNFEIIKPFLVKIYILQQHIMSIDEEDHNIDTDLIAMDQFVVEALRKI